MLVRWLIDDRAMRPEIAPFSCVGLTVLNVGNSALLIEVDVEAVRPEVPGDHRVGVDDPMLFRKIPLAEVRFVALFVMELLADKLVVPLCGLVIGVGHVWDDERHCECTF